MDPDLPTTDDLREHLNLPDLSTTVELLSFLASGATIPHGRTTWGEALLPGITDAVARREEARKAARAGGRRERAAAAEAAREVERAEAEALATYRDRAGMLLEHEQQRNAGNWLDMLGVRAHEARERERQGLPPLRPSGDESKPSTEPARVPVTLR